MEHGCRSYQQAERQLDALQRPVERAPTLLKHQIDEMLQNCLQLAAEGKITAKNAWDLHLIDHFPSLVTEMTDSDDIGAAFQRAGCTLDAGIKIYSKRVDYVYDHTFQTMQGLSRQGPRKDEDDETEEGDNENADEEAAGKTKKKRARRFDDDASATLAQPADIDDKKCDLAFAVDPLFHCMSAKFDEGSIAGLLMNNLSMFGGCNLAFSSHAVPAALVESYAEAPADRAGLSQPWIGPQLRAGAAPARDTELCPSLGAAAHRFGGDVGASEAALEAAFVSVLAQQRAANARAAPRVAHVPSAACDSASATPMHHNSSGDGLRSGCDDAEVFSASPPAPGTPGCSGGPMDSNADHSPSPPPPDGDCGDGGEFLGQSTWLRR